MARKTKDQRAQTAARLRARYEHKSGMTSRAGRIAAKAVVEKPVFIEDDDGHLIRQWKPEELQRYSNDDIVKALRLRAAVEPEDMLEFVPPSAIKYCETKGWIEKRPGGFFMVTRKAAAELELPRKTRDGRQIRFLDRGL